MPESTFSIIGYRRWAVMVLFSAAVSPAGCRAPAGNGQPDAEVGAARASDMPGGVEATRDDPLHPRVRIETTLGDILLELNAEKAPVAVLNFMQYVYAGFYEGTIFHRVLKDSMIHGGGFTSDLKEKIRGLKPDVVGPWRSAYPNKRGTVALIRKRNPGNAPPTSAQFYINVADNLHLDAPDLHGAYAVFGKVVGGEDTVERIRNTPVGTHPEYAAGRSAVVPVKPVIIKSVHLVSRFDPIQVQAAAAAIMEAEKNRASKIIERLEKETGRKAVTTASGVRYVDLEEGSGPQPLPTDTIEFQYRGTLLDGTVFESTYETQPAVRKVAKLISGLQEALLTMNEGGRRMVIIPPEQAFGEGGIPGKIPPNSTLVFEIELLSIE